MPPKKKLAKLKIFTDEPETSFQLPSRVSKRKRPGSDDNSSVPDLKRPALGDKTTNSRDSSFLRDIPEKKDTYFVDEMPPKLLKGGKKLADCQDTRVDTPETKGFPLATAFGQGTEARKYVEQHLSTDSLQFFSLVDEDKVQEAASLISEKRLWTPLLVSAFAATPVTSLDLSSPTSPGEIFIPKIPSSELLVSFFSQYRFTALSNISLRNTILSSDDVALLRLLPSLSNIDLCATGIANLALHHLVCHRHTLTHLNISNNENITDDARIILSAFPKLNGLYLRGTNFSMPALRKLAVDDLTKGCRLLSIPAAAISVVNACHEKYCVDIPVGYLEDPVKVETLTLPNLKRNLELHQNYNKDVQISGTKIELVHRLRNLLWNRAADRRILEILGKGPS